jgi:hypothetical protein
MNREEYIKIHYPSGNTQRIGDFNFGCDYMEDEINTLKDRLARCEEALRRVCGTHTDVAIYPCCEYLKSIDDPNIGDNGLRVDGN